MNANLHLQTYEMSLITIKASSMMLLIPMSSEVVVAFNKVIITARTLQQNKYRLIPRHQTWTVSMVK